MNASPARTMIGSVQVHPAALAHGRRRQQAQPLAGAGVDLEDRHPPPGLDAFQVEAGDDPVVGEAEGEARVFVERDHPAFSPQANQRQLFSPCHCLDRCLTLQGRTPTWLGLLPDQLGWAAAPGVS